MISRRAPIISSDYDSLHNNSSSSSHTGGHRHMSIGNSLASSLSYNQRPRRRTTTTTRGGSMFTSFTASTVSSMTLSSGSPSRRTTLSSSSKRGSMASRRTTLSSSSKRSSMAFSGRSSNSTSSLAHSLSGSMLVDFGSHFGSNSNYRRSIYNKRGDNNNNSLSGSFTKSLGSIIGGNDININDEGDKKGRTNAEFNLNYRKRSDGKFVI